MSAILKCCPTLSNKTFPTDVVLATLRFSWQSAKRRVDEEQMPTNAFVVQHVHERPDRSEDVKIIGIYSTEGNANAAVKRLSSQPGFVDLPDGFHVSRYIVDQDHWEEGFVTESRPLPS